MSNVGRRIFIVEDETLVLINLEDILIELGCTIVGQAMRLDEAVRLADSIELPDAAILDVNLGGAKVFPVAEILARRGVPMLFASGYGREGLPGEWQHYPVIVKPYTQLDLSRALDAMMAADGPAAA